MAYYSQAFDVKLLSIRCHGLINCLVSRFINLESNQRVNNNKQIESAEGPVTFTYTATATGLLKFNYELTK